MGAVGSLWFIFLDPSRMSEKETSEVGVSHGSVPLVDLGAQLATIRAEVDAALARVLNSNRFILGPEVEAFEAEIASYLGIRHAIGVSSGTDALLVALMALDIGPGDEVITTPFSFFATAGCIARLGARPVFVDIEPTSFLLDVTRLEEAVTNNSRAILPVHLYGECAEMTTVNEVATRHGLEVIEDAAQALGARYGEQSAGQLGHLGCFSFFPTKNLGAFGDGGLVTTEDTASADRIRTLRSHGFAPKYHSKLLGGNFRLDALQAAVLRVKLPYLERWNAARRARATTYNNLLGDCDLIRESAGEIPSSAGVIPPREEVGRRHIYHQYVIRTMAADRDRLRHWLADRRIATEIYYPSPLHLQECFQQLGYQRGDFPEAERAAAETLALPLYAELTEEMQQQVVDAIRDYYSSK